MIGHDFHHRLVDDVTAARDRLEDQQQQAAQKCRGQQASIQKWYFGPQHVAQQKGRRLDAELHQPLPGLGPVKGHYGNV